LEIATDFGDLTQARVGQAIADNATRGVIGTGYITKYN
jgi:hypothetical protein